MEATKTEEKTSSKTFSKVSILRNGFSEGDTESEPLLLVKATLRGIFDSSSFSSSRSIMMASRGAGLIDTDAFTEDGR
jgi:hypothetical protein